MSIIGGPLPGEEDEQNLDGESIKAALLGAPKETLKIGLQGLQKYGEVIDWTNDQVSVRNMTPIGRGLGQIADRTPTKWDDKILNYSYKDLRDHTAGGMGNVAGWTAERFGASKERAEQINAGFELGGQILLPDAVDFIGGVGYADNLAKGVSKLSDVKALKKVDYNQVLNSVFNPKRFSDGFKKLRDDAVEAVTGPIRTVKGLVKGDLFETGAGIRTSGGDVQGTLFDIEDYVGPLDPKSKYAAQRFNDYIATKSGYESMAAFKKEVLNRWPRKYQEQLFRELWQNKNYEGYIEHLIQKAPHMDWYWNMKGKDKNAVENVRILFNDRVKNMKDTVEKIVHGYTNTSGTFIPGKGWQNPNLADRLIVSFEDPQKRFKTFRRQNPGDVIIMRAGNDKIIGNLGQYLDVLYPQDALGKSLLQRGAKEAGFNNVAAFRNKILSDRIDIIIRDSATIPSNRTAAKRYIKDNIDKDMVELISQYPFLQPPPAIRRQMIEAGLLQGTTRVD